MKVSDLGIGVSEIWALHSAREITDADFSGYGIPKLEEDPAFVYEQLRLAEQQLVPGFNYEDGSATYNDQILEVLGANRTLLTAEHATNHKRKTKKSMSRKMKEADWGTGALGYLVGRSTGSGALIAIGRQTKDPNNDPKHVFKDRMQEIITLHRSLAHLSIHGMKRGYASHPRDERGFSVQLGVGAQPSDATKTLADTMLEKGKDLGLRVGVNQKLIRFDNQKRKPKLDENGEITTKVFMGGGGTTRAYAESTAEQLGIGNNFAAIQIEFSDVLRFVPHAEGKYPTQRDRELGAYLGHLFLSQSVKLAELH